jgi:hypothetical protein
MEREISRETGCLLSQNQIQEIVMDSGSDEEKYYAFEGREKEQEPRPTLQQSYFVVEQLCGLERACPRTSNPRQWD